MKNITMLSEKQKLYIRENYGKIKATLMAQELDVSVNSIYHYVHNHDIGKKLNPIIKLSDTQEQIVLGGILGDGSFKKNGSNYYYRECHATPEAGYLTWKYNALFDFTTKKIYDIPARKITQNAQVGFQTINSPTFIMYAQMTIDDVILRINELGLMVWLLDDGWIRRNSKSCSYAVSAAAFTDEQVDKVINKLLEYGLNAHKIGSRNDLGLNSNNNKKLKELMYKYFPKDLDVIIKKINDLKG